MSEEEYGARGADPGAHDKHLGAMVQIPAVILRDLQEDNDALVSELEKVRGHWASASLAVENASERIAQALRENVLLREQNEELERRAAKQEREAEVILTLKTSSIEPLSSHGQIEADKRVEQMEAELHKTRIALVSIVKELERRVTDKDTALREALRQKTEAEVELDTLKQRVLAERTEARALLEEVSPQKDSEDLLQDKQGGKCTTSSPTMRSTRLPDVLRVERSAARSAG